MDFKSVALGTGGLAAVSADALLVVVAGTAMPTDVDAPVASLLRDAVKNGDLELKAGRTLYVHRPSGLKAQRLVLAVAADDSAKSFRSAAATGVAALKGLGVAHVAVAQAGSSRLTEGHAEALASAVADAVYVYRHTKPSAPSAPRLAKVTLACAKADATAVTVGLRRGAAVAQGVEVARECANRPANHATPTFLAEQAKSLARQHGFKVQVLEFVDEYTAEEGIINYAQKDFVVLVDAKSQVYLNGVTVDYVRQGLNEGFEFRNPNERDRCGCGESFRI